MTINVETPLHDAYLTALLENSFDVITILNLDGTIRFESPSVERVLGYEPEELQGRRAFDFIHLDDRRRLEENFKRSIRYVQETSRVEYRFKHKDGSWKTFESVVKYLVNDMKAAGVLVNSRDITDRRSTEQLQDDFVSMVSHELRTPLTMIKGSVDELAGDLDAQLSAPQKRLLQLGLKNIARLDRMIFDLVLLSRIESGKLNAQLKTIDLQNLLCRETQTFRALAERKGLDFQLECVDAPCLVRIEEDLFSQALSHVLANAIKFTSTGRIAIWTELSLAGMVILKIADSGCGISPGNLPLVFKKFQQFGKPLNTGGEGTGLGLCIAKGLMHFLGGDITVESRLNEGTVVTITLPAAI